MADDTLNDILDEMRDILIGLDQCKKKLKDLWRFTDRTTGEILNKSLAITKDDN